jgi:hypothetical protein
VQPTFALLLLLLLLQGCVFSADLMSLLFGQVRSSQQQQCDSQTSHSSNSSC